MPIPSCADFLQPWPLAQRQIDKERVHVTLEALANELLGLPVSRRMGPDVHPHTHARHAHARAHACTRPGDGGKPLW